MKRKIVLLLLILSAGPLVLLAQEASPVERGRKLTDVAEVDPNVDLSDANGAEVDPDAVVDPNAPEERKDSGVQFRLAANRIQRQLSEALAELDALNQHAKEVKIPLSRKLNELQAELKAARKENLQAARLEGDRKLEVSNLESKIKARKEEAAYLTSLMGEYARNLESVLHVAEKQRYADPIEAAKQAADSENLATEKVYATQGQFLLKTVDRLEETLGGARFEGEVLDANGIVKTGTIAMVGPVAMFRSTDGSVVGSVEQKLGSDQPAVYAYNNPEDSQAAAEVVKTGRGTFPFDPSLGNARKIEETQDTILEHISKGGPVMYPILGMAGAAMLVVLFKWVALTMTPTPRRREIDALLQTVSRGDQSGARELVERIRGPIGRMLKVGVEHLREPRELIEEVMYETILSTKLKLQRLLPFVAIAAASAPLLGLLGTVTGIINTFRMIRVHGAGDVKSLSGGISEALITTEFGLIVAIPSLLLHAFLSRKAKGMSNEMEKTAVEFVNQVSKSDIASRNAVMVADASEVLPGDGSAKSEGSDGTPPPAPKQAPAEEKDAGKQEDSTGKQDDATNEEDQ
jgi:biopolymer transport protein ExbB